MIYTKLLDLLKSKGYIENYVGANPTGIIFYKDEDDIELSIEFMKINNDYVLTNHFVGLNKICKEPEYLELAKEKLDHLKNDCNYFVNQGVSFITHKIRVGK